MTEKILAHPDRMPRTRDLEDLIINVLYYPELFIDTEDNRVMYTLLKGEGQNYSDVLIYTENNIHLVNCYARYSDYYYNLARAELKPAREKVWEKNPGSKVLITGAYIQYHPIHGKGWIAEQVWAQKRGMFK